MKGLISVVLALMATFAIVGGATAADRWDELLMGDLADDFAAPTASGPVAPGVEFIRGRIGPDDVVDAISFIVPPGSVLTSFLVLSFPPGQTFSSAPFSLRRGPGDFSEVIEFGNFASVAFPGVDLLRFASMPGPQGPGTYALSVGHPILGPIPETRSYEVAVFTTAVPEPATAVLCLAALAGLWYRIRGVTGRVRWGTDAPRRPRFA